MARVIVDVMLKPEILDPQGRAVRAALLRQGLRGVTDVRQGKQFVIDFGGPTAAIDYAKLRELAENLLANPVIENYRIRVLDEAEADGTPSVTAGLAGITGLDSETTGPRFDPATGNRE